MGRGSMVAILSCFFFSIVGLQLVLLILWLTIDAPQSVVTITNAVEFQGIRECVGQLTVLWIILELVFFACLLLWGAYLAYQTRDVWVKFNYPNESRSILLSIYNLGFCCVVLIPMITSLNVDLEVLFLLLSLTILWPTTFALFNVYVPKIAKFIGSSWRKSGNSDPGKSRERSDRSGSFASNVKVSLEQTAKNEKKLLILDDKDRSKILPDVEGAYAVDSPRGVDTPPENDYSRKGTERMESPENPPSPTWQSLRGTFSETDNKNTPSKNTTQLFAKSPSHNGLLHSSSVEENLIK